MAGVKRNADGKDVTPPTRFGGMFEQFRDELDEHYDRKERIVKASRDVTAASKKIIFSLQRVRSLNKDLPSPIQREVDLRLAAIRTSLEPVAGDLQGINRYRYHNQMRCLEELVEALSFMHYIRTQTLISPAQAQAAVPVPTVLLNEHDYLYGIFDLFGEMMRFATVAAGRTGSLGGVVQPADGGGDKTHVDGGQGRSMLDDIQNMSAEFECFPEAPGKAYRMKMEEMRNSVKKVEALGYGLAIRRSERPKGWVPDLDVGPAPEVEQD
ncbi:Translin-associated protein X [Ceratocystis lukuohia]|uniref:Translin-associated protein X n=3 Tax=Ceratocystis TaxID=5157 RepID=A0A0F8BLS0_CERFI|nr:Translin-associated protein X [Ceratocystis platani]PHH52820.1 hypothetical protein CFIMG_005225RA [Ceratocystis fimbriata CBS 114723]